MIENQDLESAGFDEQEKKLYWERKQYDGLTEKINLAAQKAANRMG